jgi:hypothetical protein
MPPQANAERLFHSLSYPSGVAIDVGGGGGRVRPRVLLRALDRVLDQRRHLALERVEVGRRDRPGGA